MAKREVRRRSDHRMDTHTYSLSFVDVLLVSRGISITAATTAKEAEKELVSNLCCRNEI